MSLQGHNQTVRVTRDPQGPASGSLSWIPHAVSAWGFCFVRHQSRSSENLHIHQRQNRAGSYDPAHPTRSRRPFQVGGFLFPKTSIPVPQHPGPRPSLTKGLTGNTSTPCQTPSKADE